MSLYEQIDAEITGDPAEKENRKQRVQVIVDAFAKCGQELVTSQLAAEMKTIEEQFDSELGKLQAKL